MPVTTARPAPSAPDPLPDLTPWVEALRAQDRVALRALIDATPHPLPAMADDRGDRSSPLHQAITAGWSEGFQALLPVSNPHLVDASEDTPLLRALCPLCSHKTPRDVTLEMVTALAPLSDVNRPDQERSRPLALAMVRGDVRVLDVLLQHGADPTLPSNGQSLLVVAWRENGAPVMSERLIPRVNARELDDAGNTLLHKLLERQDRQGHSMPVPLFVDRWMGLVKRGADPHRINSMGWSALGILDSPRTQDARYLDGVRDAMQRWEADELARAIQTSVGAPVAPTPVAGVSPDPLPARSARPRL